MKIRIESTLGWMMLSGLGNELVPGVFKPELFPEPPLMQRRPLGMTEGLHERVHVHPAQRRLALDEATTLHGHARLAELGLDAPEPEVQTYRTDSSLWWLSWANDNGCAGIAIVEVKGEQSAKAAAAVAERLRLAPVGDWQVAGVQVPEEHRAAHEPFVGRFLTTAEAEAAFAAQSIKSYEAEQGIEIGDGELQAAGFEVVE